MIQIHKLRSWIPGGQTEEVTFTKEFSPHIRAVNIQELFQNIEHYLTMNVNEQTRRLQTDEDCIWEIANSIRWLSRLFSDKFKIESFLFAYSDKIE